MKTNFLVILFIGLALQTYAQLGTPELSSPADGSTYYVGSTINFSWTSVTDATSYDVEFDAGTGYTYLTNTVSTGLSIPLTSSSAGPHTWHVRAKKASTTGLWSSTQKYAVIGVPGVPTTGNPANLSNIAYNTSTNFTWNAVSNATGYKIQFDNDAPIVVAGTSYPNSFTSLGSHSWKVLASNPAGESAWSTTKNITVILGVSTLTSPANGYTAYVGSTINFSWTPVSGATSYDIELDPGLGYTSLTNVSGTTMNLPVVAAAIGQHSWHVRAKNGSTNGTWSSTRTYTVVGIPAVPTTNNPANGSNVNYNSATNFTWNVVTNAASYQIQFDSEAPITVTGTSYVRTFSTLGNHTWKVLASNDAGDSDWSTVKTFTVVLAGPPVNSPANGFTAYIATTLGFSWTSVPGATSYDIEFDEGLGSVSRINVATVSYQIALTNAMVGQHTWHVRAINGATIGQWSQSRTYIVAGIPGTPVLGNPATESSITYEIATNFTWNAVQYATSYQIQFDSEAPLTVTNNNYNRTFNVLGNHFWKVKAINTAGESGWSTVNNFSVVLGVPSLSSPANAEIFYVGSTASFSWSSVAGATSYDIEFDSGLGTVTLSNVSGISTNVALLATHAGTHTWHVRAKNSAANGAWSSSRTIVVIGIPLTPTTTSPASGSTIYYDAATNFTWNAVTNATSYRIQFDAEAPITVSGTSYSRTYSSFGSHTWKVLASNDAGDSGWSTSKTFTVDLGVPTLSSPANNTTSFINTTLSFTWTSVAGATSYDIEFDAGQGSASLSNVAITTKQWALVAANVGNHTWHVRARNGSVIGQWSQSRTFTVAGIPAIPVTINPPAEGTVPYGTPAAFTWNPVPNATSYLIQFDSEAPIAVTGTNFPRTFSALASHTWKVKAVNAAGESGWSTVKNFTVALGTPNLTSPVNAFVEYVGATLEFSWTSVVGATSYDIEFDSGLGYAYLTNVSGTSYNLPLAVANVGPHTWHVRAKLNATVGQWSGSRNFQVAGIPAVPTLISPTNGSSVSSDQNIAFTWNGVATATSYKIQFDNETPISDSGTSYSRSFSTLGSHTWKVLAANDAGESSWSSSYSFTVELGTPVLTSPANGSIFFVGTTINFSWTPVTGATSYDVEFDAGLGFASVTNVTSASLSLPLTAIHAGPHTWHVRAKSASATGSWSATRNYQVNGIPAVPVLTSPTDGSKVAIDTDIDFTWNSVTSATGYQIQFDSETAINVSGTTYSRTFVAEGTHTWKVLATNAAGKSEWSNINTFTVSLGIPILTTPVAAASLVVGSITVFSWTAVTGATSYDVEFDAGTSAVILSNVSGTSLNVLADVASAGTHTWHVRAKFNLANGQWSASQTYSIIGLPVAPVLIAPVNGATLYSEELANFSWNIVGNAKSYLIQVDAEAPVSVTGTTYSRTFSTAGNHSWKVLATNAAGNSDWSATRTFNLVLGAQVPPTRILSVVPDNSWNFGVVTINNTNSKTFVLQNTGNSAIKISNLVLTGLNPDQYKISSPAVTSMDIAAGGTLSVTVGFKPTSAGLKAASLSIACNADNVTTSKEISLTGTGTLLPTKTLSVDPDELFDFGNTTLNSNSDKTFILQNLGTLTISVTGISVSGINADQYAVISPAYSSFDLPSGGSQNIVVRFKPGTTGLKSAILTLTNNSDNAAPAKLLSLVGTGVVQVVIVVPSVITNSITGITSTAATGGGNVTLDGGATVIAKGICWGKTENPTIADSKTMDGTGTGSFTSNITGLTLGTTYHARAYAINSAGTAYGSDMVFSTQSLATVTTATAKATSSTAATCGGSVTSDGGAAVTAKGVCWGKNDNPTIADTKTMDGTGTGSFTSNISGLTAGTTYHARAYATNSLGTAYGSDVTFVTLAPATVVTGSVTAASSTTAIGKGDVTSDGGSPVTQKGFCWAKTANPTVADTKTANGTGIGSFSDLLSGLTPGTTYHVRAYATNSAGTSYGADISFTTPALATVITSSAAASENSSVTAIGKGNVTSDGGATVTEKGFCWSTTVNPTVGDSRTTDGTGVGTFSDIISGLTPGTTYHVRAYAINSVGTAYGEDLTFETTVNNGVFNISSYYQIYPNPSHGRIKIRVAENVPVEMNIYSLDGVLIENRKLLNKENTIDLNLEKGIYVIDLKSDKAKGSYKLVIQ